MSNEPRSLTLTLVIPMMKPKPSVRFAGEALLVALLLSSCKSELPPLDPPQAKLSSQCFFGTSLTGAQPLTGDGPSAAGFEHSTTLLVSCRAHWFESQPEHHLEPLSERIERCVDLNDAGSLHASAALIESAWISGSVDSSGTFDEMVKSHPRSAPLSETQPVAAPRGVTVAFDNSSANAAIQRKEGATTTRIEVSHLTAPDASGNELKVSLVIDGYVREGDSGNPGDDEGLAFRREVIVLKDVPQPGKAPLVLLFNPREVRGAILLEIRAESDPGTGDLEACFQLAKAAGMVAPIGASPDPLANLASLDSEYRRGALARLAIATTAPLTTDFAMVADDARIDEFVTKLGESRKDKGRPTDVALELEKATWKYLADQMSGANFPPRLSSIAVAHAGEAGHFAAVLEDVSASATSVEEIEERFVSQNLSLLEDRSPSSRVRARDWLATRKITIEGYDPLGSLADRKAALRAHEDKEAAAATEGSGS